MEMVESVVPMVTECYLKGSFRGNSNGLLADPGDPICNSAPANFPQPPFFCDPAGNHNHMWQIHSDQWPQYPGEVWLECGESDHFGASCQFAGNNIGNSGGNDIGNCYFRNY
jgi:hypothetical protein